MDRTVRGLLGVCLGLALASLAVDRAWAWKLELPPEAGYTPPPKGPAIRPVVLSKAVFQLSTGKIFATTETGIFCLAGPSVEWSPPDDFSFQSLQSLFNSEMTSLGFKVSGDPTDLFGDGGASGAEFEIGAAITGVQVDVCYGLGAFSYLALREARWTSKGAIRIDMDWQIYSRLERKVVARIHTAGGAEQEKFVSVARPSLPDGLANRAFDQNIRALANSPEYRAAISSSITTPAQSTTPAGLSRISMQGTNKPLSVADSVGSVVSVFAGEGFGSGWVVGDGYVLTNHHVVGEGTNVKIRWSDGLETAGEVVRSDIRRDVALVKTDTRGRPALAIRHEPVQPGDTVFAIGTPLDPHLQSTVTRGVVSAMRTIDGFSFIQSDVMVNHGDSGGPLLDEKGRVIGLTVSGIQPEGVPSGINLFIPVRDAIDFLALNIQTADLAQN